MEAINNSASQIAYLYEVASYNSEFLPESAEISPYITKLRERHSREMLKRGWKAVQRSKKHPQKKHQKQVQQKKNRKIQKLINDPYHYFADSKKRHIRIFKVFFKK